MDTGRKGADPPARSRNQEIASRLGITPGTVKVHLHRIYEKLGVGSRADLVIYARDRERRTG